MKMDIGIYHSDDEIPERENHQLTEFIGMDYDGDALPYESGWIKWEEKDRILLCSDGLYDMCSPEVIIKALAAGENAEKTCHTLFEKAMNCGGKDNITVMLLQQTDIKNT